MEATPAPSASAMLPADFVAPGLSLPQIFAILRAYRRTIGIVVLVCAVLAVAASKLLPKTFIASALVQVEIPTRDAETGSPLPGELAPSYLSTQVDLISSPAVLMDALDHLGWASDPAYVDDVPASSPGGPRPWLLEEKLAKNLTVSSGTKDSRLVSVTFAGRSADEAAHAANAIARAYVETLGRTADGPGAERVKTYSKQLDELRQNVDSAQARLTTFRQKTGVIDIDQRGNLDVEQERLLDLERRVIAAESDQQLAELRFRQAQRSAGADANVLSSTSVQTLKAAEANLQQRLAQISETLGPRHPEVLATRAQLAAIREQMRRETGVYGEALRGQSDTSSEDARLLRKARDDQRARVLSLRSQQDEGASLLRAVDAAKLIYEDALKSYDQVVLAGARSPVKAAIIAEALPPLRKSKPKTLVNLGIGLIGGFICAALGCLLWELTHRRIRCREDVEQVLGEAPMAVFGGSA